LEKQDASYSKPAKEMKKLIILGLALGFAVPAFAQQQKSLRN
jgi:hypothetical protein